MGGKSFAKLLKMLVLLSVYETNQRTRKYVMFFFIFIFMWFFFIFIM